MSTPWLDDYEPHTWTVLDVTFDNLDALRPVLEPIQDRELLVIGVDSQMARDHHEAHSKTPVLYFDVEQIVSANLDKVYGLGGVYRLTADTDVQDLTIPAGTLAMVVHRMDLTAKTMTLLVETTSDAA